MPCDSKATHVDAIMQGEVDLFVMSYIVRMNLKVNGQKSLDKL